MASDYFSWMRDSSGQPPSSTYEDEETGLMASISGRLTGSFDSASQFYDDFTIPTSTWIQFAVLLGLGLFFLFLSSLALPFLMVAPSKFASLFTLGSVFCLAAFISLRGWARFQQHAFGTAKKTTVMYLLSLLLTFYYTTWAPSYLFAAGRDRAAALLAPLLPVLLHPGRPENTGQRLRVLREVLLPQSVRQQAGAKTKGRAREPVLLTTLEQLEDNSATESSGLSQEHS
eukprot:CAMPEP_0178995128 /NCGR_PEP_ID=MMETSP0795-20121207/7669_1 /TAXON_ID=88552 /ORGANISM="Amoebophrya sp., Strain Ameob2" /LENGTH=229 /DNA_ID=CAMNT_0020687429 /DNA_START=163 /DNA_END=851 /DNA_ORIENTATION=-